MTPATLADPVQSEAPAGHIDFPRHGEAVERRGRQERAGVVGEAVRRRVDVPTC
jgi:hypothetical protein